ncbi:carboxymuconolactone decarboxylase family protein [Streptomyces sp. NPDC059651]|uniref:carboxymuconolactone decarboxylase family protein n=1 Tax=Streptomyces sp. NPDC059651 TaxID=3346897 RepID=UPI0036A9EEEE
MSRIALLEPPYSDRAGELLARMMPGDAQPIGLFRMFARNLSMAGAMHGWGRYELGRQLTLTTREREIVIDRTCARCGCEYEWGVHMMTFAERVELTREQATSLAYGGPGDSCWTSEPERLLILAVDMLHERSDIDDALWARLASVFDDLQLLDLLLLCGWYHAVSFAARTARLPREPGAPRFSDFTEAPDGHGGEEELRVAARAGTTRDAAHTPLTSGGSQ